MGGRVDSDHPQGCWDTCPALAPTLPGPKAPSNTGPRSALLGADGRTAVDAGGRQPVEAAEELHLRQRLQPGRGAGPPTGALPPTGPSVAATVFFFKTGGRGPPTHTRRYPQDTHSLRLILGPIYLVFRAENEHFNRHLHSSTFGKHHFCNFEYTKNMESIKIKLQKVQKIDKNFDLSGKAGPNAKFFSVKIISHQNSK